MRKKAVTIEKILRTEIPVKLTRFGRQRKPRVYLATEELGLPYKEVSYPGKVEVITLTTEKGEKFELASHTLSTFTWVEREEYEQYWENRFFRRGSRRFATRLRLPGLSLTFQNAKRLKEGQVLYHEFPFRLINSSITNGVIGFPLKRPEGRIEWDQHANIRFVREIPKRSWSLFLRAVFGLFFEEELQTTLRSIRKRMRSIEKWNAHGQGKTGQCYDGGIADKVAVGSNLLFTIKQGKRQTYLVDSPLYGRALYIFSVRNAAFQWASRRISAEKARKLAAARIIHSGNWKNRLQSVL